MPNYDDIMIEMPQAKRIAETMLPELDRREREKGYVEFHDVRAAVATKIVESVNPALFIACVRVLESKRVITILD